jgi:transposase-like protein
VDTLIGAQCAKESTMPRRRRRKFSPEFKAEAVRLVAANEVSLATIAQQLGVSRSVLCRWVDRAQPPSAEALREDERTELTRLRREVLQLRMERDLLKKATAFFARHSE